MCDLALERRRGSLTKILGVISGKGRSLLGYFPGRFLILLLGNQRGFSYIPKILLQTIRLV